LQPRHPDIRRAGGLRTLGLWNAISNTNVYADWNINSHTDELAYEHADELADRHADEHADEHRYCNGDADWYASACISRVHVGYL